MKLKVKYNEEDETWLNYYKEYWAENKKKMLKFKIVIRVMH